MCKQITFLLFFFILQLPSVAQNKIISGVIKDSHSDEVIPFASVYFKNTTIGKLSDIDGQFSFNLNNWPSDTLEITNVGYQPFQFIIDKTKNELVVNITLERATYLEPVKVRVKVNKGLLIWRKIVNNKEFNNRYRFDNFSYELYNKLEIDITNFNPDKVSNSKFLRPLRNQLKPVTDIMVDHIDSTEILPFLPVYLTEVLSDYYYQKKPLKRREVIKAGNTNGVRNESVLKLLGGMDQVVNVYNNFIPVFDKQFISPISDHGDNYYHYRVTDTQYVNLQRFYHLVFTPKRRGENTFEGDCWVHDTTFAIQKMNLRLGKEANVNFLENLSLIQEYKMINDNVWFLSKDKFVADVSILGKDKPGFIGRKTTTYKNVKVNDETVIQELEKNKMLEETLTLADAMDQDKSFWQKSRHEELTHTEKSIIQMIDTIMKLPSYNKLSSTIYLISTGYFNKGNLELGPWYYWFTYNGWEGYRARFDLGTNTKFSKKLWLHAYAAYGFTDKKMKGKAEAYYLFNKHPRTSLRLSYVNDLDFGQNYYGEVSADNVFALAIRKANVPIKFINVSEKRLDFYHETNSGFGSRFIVSHKEFTPLKNLPLKTSFPVTNGGIPLSSFDVTLQLRYAFLEKFLESNFNRISIGSPYPIVDLNISKGMAGVFKSSYNYTKLFGSISDYKNIPPYGHIDYSIYGGKTFGSLPYVLLDIHPGNELYYYNKFAFNMMNRYEFVSDEYAGVNFEHNIGNGIFRFIPKLRFRQFWNAKVLWGSLSQPNLDLNFVPGHLFQTLNGRSYIELGTGIDNILKVLRLDLVWRVAPSDLSTSTKRFGVFGSFRLSF